VNFKWFLLTDTTKKIYRLAVKMALGGIDLSFCH